MQQVLLERLRGSTAMAADLGARSMCRSNSDTRHKSLGIGSAGDVGR
jgi:hypothetical protein